MSLKERLEQMNWHFGRGKIIRVDEKDGVAHRRIPITKNTGFDETRRFRVVGDTLHFLGHQSKLSKPFKV